MWRGSPAVADRPQSEIRLSDRLALSVAEAAAAIGVSERHLRTVLPQIPHLRLAGRVLIPREQLAEWLRTEADKEGNRVDEVVGKVLEAVTQEQ